MLGIPGLIRKISSLSRKVNWIHKISLRGTIWSSRPVSCIEKIWYRMKVPCKWGKQCKAWIKQKHTKARNKSDQIAPTSIWIHTKTTAKKNYEQFKYMQIRKIIQRRYQLFLKQVACKRWSGIKKHWHKPTIVINQEIPMPYHK